MRFKIKEIVGSKEGVGWGNRRKEWGSRIRIKEGVLDTGIWGIAKVEGENSDWIPFTKEIKDQLEVILNAFEDDTK